jgi:integrase/recombinase XerD
MLTLWRRHNPIRCKLTSRSDRRCGCPIWVSGVDEAGNHLKQTTRLRDWQRAEALARRLAIGEKSAAGARVTIEDWQKAFLEYATSPAGKNLQLPTIRKYHQLFKPLTAYAAEKGYRFVNQLTLDVLTDFVGTWRDQPLSASLKLKRLRSVLKFAVQRKWIAENAALLLDTPKVRKKPTLPFTDVELKRILSVATDDARVFVQVMLHSGLRISDVATLTTDSLTGNRIRLHQAKTGEPVSVLIPQTLADDLRALPIKHLNYFFWNGKSTKISAGGYWQVRLAEVFKQAQITNGHSHRFRDTFAVRLLTAGVSLENVSILLGHNSIKTTQSYYDPWVKVRQDQLDRAVQSALELAQFGNN